MLELSDGFPTSPAGNLGPLGRSRPEPTPRFPPGANGGAYNAVMPPVRLLPFAAADGATNMAADEAMLEAAERGLASLRFYTWTEPTLSLGYFQPASGKEALASLASLACVRRSTGGAAIVHHPALTHHPALPAHRGGS